MIRLLLCLLVVPLALMAAAPDPAAAQTTPGLFPVCALAGGEATLTYSVANNLKPMEAEIDAAMQAVSAGTVLTFVKVASDADVRWERKSGGTGAAISVGHTTNPDGTIDTATVYALVAGGAATVAQLPAGINLAIGLRTTASYADINAAYTCH